jgi:uncharacterized protein DUF3141
MAEPSGIAARANLLAPVYEWGAAAAEYWVDAAQRSVLFWDVMRQRGNQYRAHMAEAAPHVLDFKAEHHRWSPAGPAGQLLSGADRAAGRRRDRSEAATVRGR